MKHYSIFFFSLVFIITGCIKEKPEGEDTCPKPLFSVYATSNEGEFEYANNSVYSNYGFYEIQYGPNGFSLGSGTTQTSTSNGRISNLANGAYDVYLRVNCGGNDWSNWEGPNSVLITNGSSSSCIAPTGLNQYWSQQDYNLNWNGNSNHNYYEVQYGPSGFTIGNGTVKTTNSTSYGDGVFTQGTTYDFYVRANCGGSDWSTWSGPTSFYADKNSNRCLKPLGVLANRNGSYIEITIQPDGESVHEVNFNNANFNDSENIHTQTQVNGTYGTFSTNTDWYVWVRSVCDDGSKTAWTGPTIIN
ncbi:MAG: hypothetical protein K9G41_07490 [Flavobacteriales bacterium]|nr:hypothetical protein [Flavobacteriales bacterium]